MMAMVSKITPWGKRVGTTQGEAPASAQDQLARLEAEIGRLRNRQEDLAGQLDAALAKRSAAENLVADVDVKVMLGESLDGEATRAREQLQAADHEVRLLRSAPRAVRARLRSLEDSRTALATAAAREAYDASIVPYRAGVARLEALLRQAVEAHAEIAGPAEAVAKFANAPPVLWEFGRAQYGDGRIGEWLKAAERFRQQHDTSDALHVAP